MQKAIADPGLRQAAAEGVLRDKVLEYLAQTCDSDPESAVCQECAKLEAEAKAEAEKAEAETEGEVAEQADGAAEPSSTEEGSESPEPEEAGSREGEDEGN